MLGLVTMERQYEFDNGKWVENYIDPVFWYHYLRPYDSDKTFWLGIRQYLGEEEMSKEKEVPCDNCVCGKAEEVLEKKENAVTEEELIEKVQ